MLELQVLAEGEILRGREYAGVEGPVFAQDTLHRRSLLQNVAAGIYVIKKKERKTR